MANTAVAPLADRKQRTVGGGCKLRSVAMGNFDLSTRSWAPGVLKEPVEFVARYSCGMVEPSANSSALCPLGVDLVMIDVVQFRDRADEIGIGN
jgi:hypothetical protein